MKYVIIGGVAGGASVAARLRRNDENAEIVLLERGEYVSYANCGLPYYIGGTINNRENLFVQTAEGFRSRFNIDIRTRSEAEKIDPVTKTVQIYNLEKGSRYSEPYDKLILSPGKYFAFLLFLFFLCNKLLSRIFPGEINFKIAIK